MSLSEDQLRNIVENNLSPQASAWLSDKLDRLKGVDDAQLQTLDIALSMAKRKVGGEKLNDIPQLSLADGARILLLLNASDGTALSKSHLIQRAYAQGDEYEKEAILKGITLLDPEGQLCELAVDACRTNMTSMMSAISFHNLYPATHFGEREFNQMVLKCIFMGLNISAVQGLQSRRSTQLSKMCMDYVLECRPADRLFPPSLWLAIRIDDVPEHIEVLMEYSFSSNPEHFAFIVKSFNLDGAIQTQLRHYITNGERQEFIQLLNTLTNNNN